LGQKKYKEGDTKQDEGNTILVLPNTIGVKLMRVTTKGQVTIPRNIRETLGIMPETEVDFKEENGRYYIVKSDGPKESKKFKKLRGIATANMSTDEIMSLIRGY
jgi:AbrB family looped-hinge helix DNA binding protein